MEIIIATTFGIVLAYWLGYKAGRKSAMKTIMPIVEDVVTKNYRRK